MKLTILTLTLLLTALAQLTVQPVQAEVSIPDGNLAAAIRQTLGLPTDAAITADAMRELTELDASGKGITSVTGLEHAVNLTALDLGITWVHGGPHANPISDVSPLSALTQLTYLNLDDTAVSDVSPLANLTQLTELNLEFTDVSDVSPLSALTQLTYLWLADTAVSDVSPLANLTQLETLVLNYTAVSDVSPLANLTQLTELYLDRTAVSDVSPLANLTQLETLYLGRTAVSDVSPLSALTQLTYLWLADTAVSDVSPLANLTQLTELSLSDTAVSDVSPLANLTQLETLVLNDTGVSDVSPLANLTQLETLYLENCPLNAAAHQTHIPAIQANGTEVTFSPFKPIHLPQVPWLVSLIYFRPSDKPVRPNVDAEIDGHIKKAQRFFADQLELHGFGRKTFQFEADANGNAVVHHVNGKFPYAHYQNQNFSFPYPWVDEIREQIYIPPRSITVHMLDSDPDGRSFTVATGSGGNYGGSVDIGFWGWRLITHELAHAFGLEHDWRADANAKRIKTFTDDLMLASFCAAEWLSVHPAFNPGQPVSTRSATIEMLPPTLASPPNTIRLRFEVTDLDGLHQAQLRIPDFVAYAGQYPHMVDCKSLNGRHSTVEFFTTAVTPQIEEVTLSVIDVRGRMSARSFPIDDPSLLPPAKDDPSLLSPAKVVSLPDPNLADAVREVLKLSVSEPITTHAMLPLTRLSVPDRGIKDFTGLEHAGNLKELELAGNYGLRDVSPLANLTQLTWLRLYGTGVSDVSPLANLTQLTSLGLGDTAVSDVSPLLGLNLTGTSWESMGLNLRGSPLSYASIHTHIPAMQAKGIEVEFDNVAHPALLKTSGDSQEGEPGATLKTPFVVEAMDEHGKPIVGKPVRFSVLEGEGTLSAKTVETDARGKARVTLTLGWYPGVNKVKATSEGIRSYVLFTAVGTEEAPQPVADVNGDGSVNIQDLVLVSGQLGKTGKSNADVNGDGVVNIQDLVLVAGAFGEGAAAPSARAISLSRLTASDVETWLSEARGSIRSGSGDPELQNGSASRTGSLTYLRGIAVLEQLLASLMPKATVLLANYPNPFNPETWIPYQLANPAEVTVTIYAANGAVVRMLDLGHRRAGSYDSRGRAAYWDGRNTQGEPVASGVYFYTLQAGDFTATRKMVIRK